MNREINLLEPKPEPVEVSTGGPPELGRTPPSLELLAILSGRFFLTPKRAHPLCSSIFCLDSGNMAGRNAYTVAGGKHYPNLFGVLVGSTNGGRKGTSWNCIKDVLRQIDPDWGGNSTGKRTQFR